MNEPRPGLQRADKKKPSTKAKGKYDSPWKTIIERHFRAFLAFFFPEIEQAIDWTRPPQSLDKELESLDPDPASAATDLRVGLFQSTESF